MLSYLCSYNQLGQVEATKAASALEATTAAFFKPQPLCSSGEQKIRWECRTICPMRFDSQFHFLRSLASKHKRCRGYFVTTLSRKKPKIMVSNKYYYLKKIGFLLPYRHGRLKRFPLYYPSYLSESTMFPSF
jgi:hypothetical protein